MKTVPLYSAIAALLATIERCKSSGSREWADHHQDSLDALLKEHLPSGSGIDNGTQLVTAVCKANRLVFQCDFHHMNEHGYYDGWTHHRVIVSPSLELGAVLKVLGRNRNGIKEYLHDVFHQVMFVQVDPYAAYGANQPKVEAS
jgi:hypothetical protein